MVRTYIDSNVLITAYSGSDEYRRSAASILEDKDREFVSSMFLRLEILPKPAYHKLDEPVEYFEKFLSTIKVWVDINPTLISDSYDLACQYGLSAMDALHLASALRLKADEFITAEKPSRPLFRASNIKVTSIYIP